MGKDNNILKTTEAVIPEITEEAIVGIEEEEHKIPEISEEDIARIEGGENDVIPRQPHDYVCETSPDVVKKRWTPRRGVTTLLSPEEVESMGVKTVRMPRTGEQVRRKQELTQLTAERQWILCVAGVCGVVAAIGATFVVASIARPLFGGDVPAMVKASADFLGSFCVPTYTDFVGVVLFGGASGIFANMAKRIKHKIGLLEFKR